MNVAPHQARLAIAMEEYGELMKVRLENGRRFSFEFYVYSGVCCHPTFAGHPTERGDRMEGSWPAT